MCNKSEQITLNAKNEYHSVDISLDGKRFVVAGLQTQIEFYDYETCKNLMNLTQEKNKCHSNKIFSVRYSPFNPNQIYSGGWDMNVKIWDVRAGTVSQNICGTQTCSDSLDMDSDGRTLVTGGGTSGEGVQVWDLRNTTKPICRPSWYPYSNQSEPTINCTRFILGQGMVVAACTDDQAPVKCWNFKTGGSLVQEWNTLDRCAYAVDVSSDGQTLSMSDVTGNVILENLVYATH